MKISLLILFSLSLILISCEGNQSSKKIESEIESAFIRLKNKNETNSWIVIKSNYFSEDYIQFYSADKEIYFDFPIFSEIKNKYKDSRFSDNVEHTENNTFINHHLTDLQVKSIKNLLKKYNLDYTEMRIGFIEPTIKNQTDTTGWTITLRGLFLSDFSKSPKFIDDYFKNIYGLNGKAISYIIEEN